MNHTAPKQNKPFEILIAVLAWLAVLLQLYLIIANRIASVPETIIRFFSFYTILTNILVAIHFTSHAWGRKGNLFAFFQRATTSTAITVYITIVGIIYNIILRLTWQPTGLQLVVDELLHTVIPLLCIVYWWMYIRASRLGWKNFLPWLWYPGVYFAFVIIRGIPSGFYPYPFINVEELGYQKVLINALLILVAFVIASLLFIGISKWSFFRRINEKAINN